LKKTISPTSTDIDREIEFIIHNLFPAYDINGSGRITKWEFCSPGGLGDYLKNIVQEKLLSNRQNNTTSSSSTSSQSNLHASNIEQENVQESFPSTEDFSETNVPVLSRYSMGSSMLNNVASLPVATPIPSDLVSSPQNDVTDTTNDYPELNLQGTSARRQISIKEFDESKQMLHVKIPSGMMPGQQVRINSPDGLITVTIPNRRLWKWNDTMNYNYFETEVRKQQIPEHVLNKSGSWA